MENQHVVVAGDDERGEIYSLMNPSNLQNKFTSFGGISRDAPTIDLNFSIKKSKIISVTA